MDKLKKYWKGRKEKWGKKWYLFKDVGKNRKANWIVLLLETVVILYLVSSVWGCSCAYATCGIKHYAGAVMDWEADGLDCFYVQDYISKGNANAYLEEQFEFTDLQELGNVSELQKFDNTPE